MSYVTPMLLLYLCEKAVQQMVTPDSLCYVYFIYIQMNGSFSFFNFFISSAQTCLCTTDNICYHK